MAEIDPEEFEDPKEVADAIDDRGDAMMDLNMRIIDQARRSARMYQELQLMHLQQAERAYEIAQLIAVGAKFAADLAGDLITAEYDLGDILFDEYNIRSKDTEEDDDSEEEE